MSGGDGGTARRWTGAEGQGLSPAVAEPPRGSPRPQSSSKSPRGARRGRSSTERHADTIKGHFNDPLWLLIEIALEPGAFGVGFSGLRCWECGVLMLCTQGYTEPLPRDCSSFPSQLSGVEVIRITELISWHMQAGDPGSAVLDQGTEKSVMSVGAQ